MGFGLGLVEEVGDGSGEAGFDGLGAGVRDAFDDDNGAAE